MFFTFTTPFNNHGIQGIQDQLLVSFTTWQRKWVSACCLQRKGARTPSLSNESLHQATNCEAGTTMPQQKLPAKKQCVRRSRDLVNPSPRPMLLLSLAQPLWVLPGRPPAAPPMLAYTEPALSNTRSWVWSFNQLKLVCLPSLIQWPKTFPSMFINNHKSHNESCVSP